MSVETKYLDHFRLPLMIILSTVSIHSGTPVLLSDGDETATSMSQGTIRSNVDLIGRKLMERNEYLTDPCGKLSIPYWKAKTLVIPDSIKIIHCRNWSGQYSNYQRFFRIMHDLKDLCPIDFDYDTLSVDYQAADLAEMINASYSHENIVVTEKEILEWRQHETFREDLCICINADDGKMIASGIAEFDEICREGIIEWVQVLPEYRKRGLGKKIVDALLRRLKGIGADFVTVSGNLDNSSDPLKLYRKCGFTGDDIWYICRVQET